MEPHSHRHYGTLQLPQALILLLRTCLAGASHETVSPSHTDVSLTSVWKDLKTTPYQSLARLLPFVDRGDWTSFFFVGMVELTAICGFGSLLWLWSKRKGKQKRPGSSQSSRTFASEAVGDDPSSTDPGLLKKHSSIRAYTVSSTGYTYPAIRTFYRPHPQESKLPNEPCPIPLLVFIHGLGGSVAQFHPILISLVNLAPCLAVDLPGCGLSSFEPKTWDAYTTEALVRLLAVAIDAHRDQQRGQQVILIGHSMGCSLAALLASSTSPFASLLSKNVAGVITICPQAVPPTAGQSKFMKRLTMVPVPIFDLIRKWDRRGGVNSKSVLRMTGSEADQDTKKLQLRFNQQSRTPVWLRMARGMLPDYTDGTPRGGLPGRDVWAGVQLPVFLIAGELDTVTSPDNLKKVVKFLGRDVNAIEPPNEHASLPIAAAPIDPAIVDSSLADRKHHDSGVDASDLPSLEEGARRTMSTAVSSTIESQDDTEGVPSTVETPSIGEPAVPASTNDSPPSVPPPHPKRLVVKTIILPKPAAHSLLFAPSTSRIVSGLIGGFLSDHMDPRLSLGWQLQYLTTEGKWDVKNLAKWQAIPPVSDPIADTFRAMKTLREVDDQHSPKIFAKEWAGKIYAVVDISHESPVYDPKGFEPDITYYKFPTVSKLPPSAEEVKHFVELINKIQAEKKPSQRGLIGVHCHYGFNRTGFFLVSYLVECLGFRVEDAIEHFAQKRPKGIRHDHFIDTLHVRYCVGLKKAPTL